MKIAYLSADRGISVFGNKGASVHIRELVNALSALGHEVTVLAARQGIASSPLKARIIEVSAEALPLSIEVVDNKNQEGILAKEQCSLGLSAAMLQQLLKLHAHEAFDLIYERYSLWSAAGVRAAQALKVPCVVEVNAPLLEEQQHYRQLVLESQARAIETQVFGGADIVVAVSDQVKAYALARGADPERTVVIRNGVDITRFHPAVEPEPLEGVEGKCVVGFVGSFKPWHGLEVLLEAFRILCSRSSASHLLLVGDGPLRGWIEGYIQGARLQGMVTITGWVPYEKLPGLIQRMQVAVAPYPFLENFYFSPLKLFEYMAMAKPVVASRIGQIQEIIQDSVTGLLIRPGDAQDLVEQIERLQKDQGLGKAIGMAASQQATQHTWEQAARRMLAAAQPLTEQPMKSFRKPLGLPSISR